MNTINASHILVKTEKEALDILHKLIGKEISFEDAARKFSFCPSKKQGGSLGTFGKGMMVKEFEEVCFNDKNKAGDVKRIYPCILVFANEKNINGTKNQIEIAKYLKFLKFVIVFHRNQINGK